MKKKKEKLFLLRSSAAGCGLAVNQSSCHRRTRFGWVFFRAHFCCSSHIHTHKQTHNIAAMREIINLQQMFSFIFHPFSQHLSRSPFYSFSAIRAVAAAASASDKSDINNIFFCMFPTPLVSSPVKWIWALRECGTAWSMPKLLRGAAGRIGRGREEWEV